MAELFLKVVNMSIAAGWLVLVVAVVRLFLKKAPKWVNPLLWGIVGLRLVLPVSIESVLSLIPSAEPISPEIMYMPEPVIATGFPVVNDFINPVITGSLAPEAGASVNPLQILIPIAAVIWMAGIAGMLTYTAVSYFRLRRRVQTSVLLCRNIYQSEQVKSPFVLGVLRPRIYLPFKLEEENLSYVIAHEESHIHRHDNWIKPLGFLLLSVYWFHPLIWLGYILFCRDIELACDERVIKEMNHEERADYSQALLNCSVSKRMLSASPLTFSEVDVKERVKRVLTYKKPAFLLTVTAVCVCGVVAVCFLTNPKTISATGEDSSDIAIIGGADGPTDIYLLSSEELAMQDFLKEFYSFNKDGRLDTFNENMNSGALTPEDLSLYTDTYYKNFIPMLTEEGMEYIESNRLPMKYEKLMAEKYTSVTVDDIQLKLYADTTYEYTATIAFSTGEKTFFGPVTGQISVDETGRVSNIYVEETKEFVDTLMGKTTSSEETKEDDSAGKENGELSDMYTLDEYDDAMKNPVGVELDEDYWRKVGEIQYAHYQKYKEVRGDLSKEYELHVQMGTEVDRLLGVANPEASARDRMTKAYALYLAASESGYAASGLDVQKYLYEQKGLTGGPSVSEDNKAIMAVFPSEDEYWDYRAMICEKKLPVEEYLEDKEKAFAEEKGMDISSQEFFDLWGEEGLRLMQEAVDKYFSPEGNMEAEIIPLEKEAVLAAAEKAGLEVVIPDSETYSTAPGQISYSLRSPDKTYENTDSPILIGSVTYTTNNAWGQVLGASFMSEPREDVSNSAFSWEDWKKQLAFSAILYGGFDDSDEIYETFSAMDLPTEKGYSWDAQLSGGYCQIEWRDSGMSQTMLSVLLYENKTYFDAYQEQRRRVASPFTVEITSAEILETSDGKKELALSVAIENDTDEEWQEVWFECQFNREAGAFIADHFVNGYESDKVELVAAKNDTTSDIHGLEYEWRIPLTTEEDLARNYDYLSMEDITSAFKEITVTVHAFGKKTDDGAADGFI